MKSSMKRPEPVNLELGIRALEHERLAMCPSTVTFTEADYAAGYRRGLDHAIQTLRNLNVANQAPEE